MLAGYEERVYRGQVSAPDLKAVRVRAKESDLMILGEVDLAEAGLKSLTRHRLRLEHYIARRPEFLESLVPLDPDPVAPEVARRMIEAARAAGVGPMAAVAGAVAELVGQDLAALSPQLIVENGGDIFICRDRPTVVALGAGRSPLSGRIGLTVPGGPEPCGVCTSSGTVGHSRSFGRADAVCVVAETAALGDAAATATANRVRTKADFDPALNWVLGVPGVRGAVAILGADLAAAGEIELVRL